MLNPCERMIDRIIALFNGELDAVQAAEVRKHINECSGCKSYLEKLENDDRMLSEFAMFSEEAILRVEQNVCAAIENIEMNDEITRWNMWAKITQSRNVAMRYAAAAAIIVVAGLMIMFALIDKAGRVDRYVAERTVKDISEQIESADSQQLKYELEQTLEFAKAGDVDGLIGILKTGSMPAKLLAAQVLADMGAVEAIEPLTELSDQSDDPDNAFQQAIDEILEKQVDDQQSGDAVINQTDIEDANSSVKVEKPVYMSGYIYDAQTGEGVDDATVNIYGPVQRNAFTDANGFYAFRGQAKDGIYNVRIFSTGYINSFTQDTINSIEIVSGEILNKDFQLYKGCMIDLEVVDDVGEAVAGAKVAVYKDFGENAVQQSGISATDANGFVLLGAYEPTDEKYSILITHPNFAPSVYSVSVNDVNVIEYARAEMQPGFNVKGYAYYNDGKPAANVMISAQPENYPAELMLNVVAVDSNGFFELNSIVRGKYSIRALNNVNNQLIEIADINLPVPEDLLEVLLPINSPETYQSIEGTLNYDTDMRSIGTSPGIISISAMSQSGKSYNVGVKAGEQKFSLKELEKGVYTLLIRGGNIETVIIENVASDTNDLVIDLNVVFTPIVSGRVFDAETRQAITNFKARIVDTKPENNIVISAKKDWFQFENTDGVFQLEAWIDEQYGIEVIAKGYQPFVMTGLQPGKDLDLQIELVAEK